MFFIFRHSITSGHCGYLGVEAASEPVRLIIKHRNDKYITVAMSSNESTASENERQGVISEGLSRGPNRYKFTKAAKYHPPKVAAVPNTASSDPTSRFQSISFLSLLPPQIPESGKREGGGGEGERERERR